MESIKKQIELLIEEGSKFTPTNFAYPTGKQYAGEDTPEWALWKRRCANTIHKHFSDNSPVLELTYAGVNIITKGNYFEQFERAKATILKALKLGLEVVENDTFDELRQPKAESKFKTISNKIFIVHGHDVGLKTETENFLHEVGLEPVVLHKKPDEGQTIIEKFEKHSDVGYAFVLLTPDEVAYLADQDSIDDSLRTKEMRARPNVIFEFGYFVGKLGRNRVCCLYKGNVTLPSDLSGLIYKKISSSLEAEGFSIIKELKSAGYSLRI